MWIWMAAHQHSLDVKGKVHGKTVNSFSPDRFRALAMVAFPRFVAGLKDVARLYRCVLFDVGALRVHGEGGLWGPCSAGALHSARELLARDKRVGVLSGSPLRAKVIKAATCEGGLPAEVAAWTSGELICRSLEGSLSHEAISALPRPPKVFELGIFVKPQRWSDTARRGAPPLEGLARAGHLKRVESIEDANLCYWDAQEGDKLDHWLEAAVELCADLKVPLLQPKWGAAALDAVAPLAGRTSGTVEAVSANMRRFSGQVISVGKLDRCFEGLGWARTSAWEGCTILFESATEDPEMLRRLDWSEVPVIRPPVELPYPLEIHYVASDSIPITWAEHRTPLKKR
eukprot:s2441_g4.t1